MNVLHILSVFALSLSFLFDGVIYTGCFWSAQHQTQTSSRQQSSGRGTYGQGFLSF